MSDPIIYRRLKKLEHIISELTLQVHILTAIVVIIFFAMLYIFFLEIDP